jgi:hypothetical protein
VPIFQGRIDKTLFFSQLREQGNVVLQPQAASA